MSVALKVEGLSKLYRLGQIGTGTLSHDLHRWWAKVRGQEDPFLKVGEVNDQHQSTNNDLVWSLRDLNFEINEGDAVGIIGRNGAGKSTLLKILSRVTSPTTGSITGEGRIASLLEVGTGFHPELSGRENIFLNGAILGMRKREIKRRFDEIVEFAGVERYIDTPVKRYSSGMYVRLAFAVAAHLDSEILIVDEVLAVGDAEFQKKCLGKMSEVSKGEGKTVLFVSHNMGAVSQLCNTGILMKNGTLVKKGNVNEVLTEYLKSSNGKTSQYKTNDVGEKLLQILSAVIVDENNNECNIFSHTQQISIVVNLKNVSSLKGVVFSLGLSDFQDRKIFTEQIRIMEKSGYQQHTITLPLNLLRPNDFKVSFAIHIPNVEIIEVVDSMNFEIVDGGSEFSVYGNVDNGVIFPALKWQITQL